MKLRERVRLGAGDDGASAVYRVRLLAEDGLAAVCMRTSWARTRELLQFAARVS